MNRMNRKLNKYEKKIMLNLHIITFLCILSSLLNFILPFVEKPKFTLFLLSQIIVISAVYIYGWVSSRTVQIIPIIPTFIIRALQALIFVVWRQDMTFLGFGILLFFDILYLAVLGIDKANYYYDFGTKKDDEFFDE